uniref:Transcription factor bHLH131 n=1 Tax=Selenicereus monacanthus TaxID=1195128 RepID=A0A249Y797_9CARY|nr:transcription factor bHLH131 [Selenicereus monacanthus]
MAKNSFCFPYFPEEETTKELAGNGLRFEGKPSSTSWASMHQEQGGFAEDHRGVASSAYNSHRQAEKRRRDRINAQLARLRKLIPKSEKMDKAALLERVVEQVRDLKRKVSDTSKFLTVPTEVDEVTIECHTDIQRGSPANHDDHHHKNNKNKNKHPLIKVTFCCEDRPDLITELIRALKGLNLTTIGADIVCLGGRMKSILILDNENVRDGGKEDVCNVSAIKESLMSVLNRIVSWSTSTPSFRVSSKRQRFFFSSY